MGFFSKLFYNEKDHKDIWSVVASIARSNSFGNSFSIAAAFISVSPYPNRHLALQTYEAIGYDSKWICSCDYTNDTELRKEIANDLLEIFTNCKLKIKYIESDSKLKGLFLFTVNLLHKRAKEGFKPFSDNAFTYAALIHIDNFSVSNQDK